MNRFPPPTELLPHAGRAILIDAVLEDSPTHTLAAAEITATHPYFEPGRGVPVWVGMEMMAQAVAAHGGLLNHTHGQPPRRGMLLGTRRYAGRVPYFTPGMRLHILARLAFGEPGGGMAAFDCRIDSADTLLVEASLTIIEETGDA
jgi:predicted hotdog family 3-hydroxylacyl-ACP dehydratase